MRLDDNRLYFLPGSEPSQVGLQEMSSKSILETFSLLRSHLSGFRVDAPFNFQFEPESFPRGHGEGKSLGSGIGGFQSDFGCLPPKAIVDSEGKPLLSWRVMLLPYLGYEHLFSLFHLDEPWDSDHNAKLIPYMPGVYGGTQNSTLDPGKATIVGLVGDDAWFPVAGLRFLSDFVQPYRYTISQLETKSEHSVVWTAPVDLRLDDPDFQTKILVVVEEGPVIGGQQQPYKSFFHGAIGSGLLTKLPYDEQKLRATATIHRDGASVMSLRNE